ncbi:MAG: hypothetical protein P1V35_16385 [Planctomycetota bacterium]|nr:hypothetical protein [Planctomycetota bacterium]
MNSDTPNLNGTLEFYSGTYGPTLRFHTFEESTLERLGRVFQWLASDADAALDLCKCPGVKVSGIGALGLNTVLEQPRLPVERLDGDTNSYRWSNTRDEWNEIMRLFEGMLGDGGGHQYFSEERPDSVLIVIAYNEDLRPTRPHRIIACLDPDAGPSLIGLARDCHVWAVRSLPNEMAARVVWSADGSHSLEKGLTVFEPLPSQRAEEFSALLDLIQGHHGEYSHDPPLSVIDVLGAKSEGRIADALSDAGFDLFEPIQGGFRATSR